MPVTQNRPGPYTAPSAVATVLEKHRNRGLSSPIDASVLERIGIPVSLIPRTLQALQTLDLITEDGNPSEVLEGLRLAPEAEYKKRMAEWLTDTYADALKFVDPATASETEIRDAFRKYTPTGQQSRMVSLFIGLFTAAGVMPPRQQAPRTSSAKGARPPRPIYPAPPARQRARPKPSLITNVYTPTPGLPPALAGLLQSLPANGDSWTQETRDKFYKTFGAVLDFCVPIGEPQTGTDDDENGD